MPNRGIVLQKLRSHPLVDLLFTLKGNPRTLVFIEPLWGIPNSLIAPFTAVYMRALGVSDVQIGIALSIAMAMQVIVSLYSGVITDKIGRKAAAILGEGVGWMIPCAIWAVAQNYGYFLVAMAFNCVDRIGQTGWGCLLVEDADERDILNMWNWISVAGLLAVFFSPVSGSLIAHYDLVPVMRVLYAIYSVSIGVKLYITVRGTTETEHGIVRRAETKGKSVNEMLRGYWKLIPRVIRDNGMMRVLAIMTVFQTTSLISNNFFSLYTTGRLGIPETYLAYFPIIRACVLLLFLFGIQHKLQRFRTKGPMCVGLVLYVASQLLVIFCPPNAVWPLIWYMLADAIAFGLVFPRKELMTAMFVEKQERARILAMLMTLMLVATSPFGGIAGGLSKLDGRLPFVLNIALFALAFVVIVTMKQDPGTEVAEE